MRTDDYVLSEQLTQLAGVADRDTVRDALDGIRPEDIAEALPRVELDVTISILSKLDSETAAYVLIELPDETAKNVVNQLPDSVVAHYLDILPMDDAVELRDYLDKERFEALLNVIPEEDAEEIRRLLSHPEGSAGQIMTENFVRVPADASMAEVIKLIRTSSDEQFETVNYIYVVNETSHLLGLLTLKRVLRSHPTSTAGEIMNPDPITAPVTMPQEELARMLARYGFSAIPILDDRGRMLGIVTADDAQEVLDEAATEDVLMLGAVSGDAERYVSLSVVELVKRRLPWLLILFVAEFLTGNVLRYYVGKQADQDPTASLAILNKLQIVVPLLIGAGGNAGSQVTSTITRALALDEVKPSDWFSVVRRELVVACIIGGALGLLSFIRSYLPIPIIGWGNSLPMSLVIGCSLPAIILWAAVVGSMLPLAAKRLGIDPAVMSAPFISTFVDATGLIIFFEIARRVLGTFGIQF